MIIYSIGKTIKNFVKVKIYLYANKVTGALSKKDTNAAGIPEEEGHYKRWYYPDGKIKAEVYLKNGKMEGIANLYHENGNIKAREFYRNDQLQGLSKWYYETGELKSEKYYRDGILAHLKEYDLKGRLIRENYLA